MSLLCGSSHSGACDAVDANGIGASDPYVVPSGYTLIMTDWEWITEGSTLATPGTLFTDELRNGNSTTVAPVFTLFAISPALADQSGIAYAHEHYATGLRVGSGVEMEDNTAALRGIAAIEGYLVPND